ncbi:MAG: hypothetical protein ACLQHS_04805 [Candidatus Limnocylindrales bacterium]
MSSKFHERPGPVGINARGIPVYDARAIRCYRLLSGVAAEDVATAWNVSLGLVTSYERDDAHPDARAAVAILNCIDTILRQREKLIERGEKMAAELEAGTYQTPRRPVTVRSRIDAQ